MKSSFGNAGSTKATCMADSADYSDKSFAYLVLSLVAVHVFAQDELLEEGISTQRPASLQLPIRSPSSERLVLILLFCFFGFYLSCLSCQYVSFDANRARSDPSEVQLPLAAKVSDSHNTGRST